MKKSVLIGAGIGLSIILLSVIAMYLGLVFYYSEGFSYGTWINGVYCTGKSINEVNDELLKQWNYEGLTITDSDGESYTILSEEVNLNVNYERTLELYLQKQNPYLWVDNLIQDATEKQVEACNFICRILNIEHPPLTKRAVWHFIHDHIEEAVDIKNKREGWFCDYDDCDGDSLAVPCEEDCF